MSDVMGPMVQEKKSDLASLRIPPHSTEAEQSVLGALMLDNNTWDDVAEHIKEQDFYRREHRLIFQAMCELSREEAPFDVLTLQEKLKSMGHLDEIGGEALLFQLASNTPSAANAQAYAKIVAERALLRNLITTANSITTSAYQPEGRTSHDLIDMAERSILEISESHARGNQARSLADLAAVAVEKINELYESDSEITGLSTGYTDLDSMTSGLQPGDLIIVAGRPSMGKTAFSMNIAEDAAIRSQKTTLIFSMEMPGDSLALRMISSLGRIDQHRVRSGKLNDDDWPRVSSALNLVSKAPMYIDDTPALSPTELRSRARRIHQKSPLGLIVVDYLQLMQVPGSRENRVAEISEISRSLKAIAKELNVPVIALSQLNRGLEQRPDKRPVMSDLRESGALEQDADLITFIYRDEVYNENSPDKGTAEIIIAKQRNGPIGKVRLTFLGKYTCFENFARQNYSPGESHEAPHDSQY